MHRLGRALCGVLVGCLALVPACSDGDGDEDSAATVPPATSTTTTSIDVSTVPDTITVEYAQAVMDELDKLLGDAIRELVAAGEPSDKFVAMLKAVYDEPAYSVAETGYGEDAAREFDDYDSPAGGPVTRVDRVFDSSKRCLVLLGTRSFAPLYKVDPPAEKTGAVIQLMTKDPAGDPSGLNPTAWRVVADTSADSTDLPENPCK